MPLPPFPGLSLLAEGDTVELNFAWNLCSLGADVEVVVCTVDLTTLRDFLDGNVGFLVVVVAGVGSGYFVVNENFFLDGRVEGFRVVEGEGFGSSSLSRKSSCKRTIIRKILVVKKHIPPINVGYISVIIRDTDLYPRFVEGMSLKKETATSAIFLRQISSETPLECHRV